MNVSKLILALDLTERQEAVDLVREIGKNLFAVKVNWPLVMNTGIGIIDELSEFSRVICDFKLADVPNTVSLVTEKAREHGAYGIIAHAFPGADSLRKIVETAQETKVYSVVSMSNQGSTKFVDPVMDDLIKISLEAGVHGFIAPGNRLDILSHIRNAVGNAPILSPGIGAQGGNAASAIEAGASYIIVGRSIYQSQDPVAVVNEINSSLQ